MNGYRKAAPVSTPLLLLVFTGCGQRMPQQPPTKAYQQIVQRAQTGDWTFVWSRLDIAFRANLNLRFAAMRQVDREMAEDSPNPYIRADAKKWSLLSDARMFAIVATKNSAVRNYLQGGKITETSVDGTTAVLTVESGPRILRVVLIAREQQWYLDIQASHALSEQAS